MSSYILSGATLAYLSNFIADLHNVGFNGMHIHAEIPTEFIKAVSDSTGRAKPGKIFKELYSLNRKAYLTRYPEEEAPTADEIGSFKEYDTQIHNYDYQIQPYHYQILKSLQCYIYNCTESQEIIDSTAYKTVEAIEKALMYHIIDQLPEYQEAKWG